MFCSFVKRADSLREDGGLFHFVLLFLIVSEVKQSQTRMTAINLKCSCGFVF